MIAPSVARRFHNPKVLSSIPTHRRLDDVGFVTARIAPNEYVFIYIYVGVCYEHECAAMRKNQWMAWGGGVEGEKGGKGGMEGGRSGDGGFWRCKGARPVCIKR